LISALTFAVRSHPGAGLNRANETTALPLKRTGDLCAPGSAAQVAALAAFAPQDIPSPAEKGRSLLEDPVVLVHPPLNLPLPSHYGRPPRSSPVHWPAIAAATTLAVVLVAGLVVWVAVHPGRIHTAPVPAESATLRPLVEESSVAVLAEPLPVVRPVVVTRRVEPPPPVPVLPASPPPLPARVRPAEPEVPVRPPSENYGTSVMFLGSPADAAEVARREKKLVFVLHVSGNFEESCFT
jgi:hypothetical protein